MRDWLTTTKKDRECLRAAKEAEMRLGTWRPWRGAFGRSARLCKNGMLHRAGISSMPPYIVYVTTSKAIEELEIADRLEGAMDE